MERIVLIKGDPHKDVKEEPKGTFHNGELQKRIEEFINSHDGKIIEILPISIGIVLIRYKE